MARDFYGDAERILGLDEREATELLESLEEFGFDPERNSLGSRGIYADDIAFVMEEMSSRYEKEEAIPEPSGYSLSARYEYGIDEMLDAGIEVEVTIDYEETA